MFCLAITVTVTPVIKNNRMIPVHFKIFINLLISLFYEAKLATGQQIYKAWWIELPEWLHEL